MLWLCPLYSSFPVDVLCTYTRPYPAQECYLIFLENNFQLLQNRKRFQKSARSFYSKGGRWKDLPLSRTGLFVAVTVLSFRPTQLILIRLSQPIGIEITFGRFALSRAFTLNFNFKSGQSVVSSMRTRTYEQANKFEFAYIERARISFRIPSSSKKFIKDTSNDSKLQFSLSGDGSRLPNIYSITVASILMILSHLKHLDLILDLRNLEHEISELEVHPIPTNVINIAIMILIGSFLIDFFSSVSGSN